VYLAYVDDSGNIGLPGSQTYTLACVFFDVGRWPEVFDSMIDFRRSLAHDYGVPVRTELKANYLLRGKGPLWKFNLNEAARHAIYLAMMKIQEALELQTFAIVVNKPELPATTLARLTGHADAGFTLRVYARDGRDDAALVEDVLGRAAEAKVGG
jgi:hypothetical protein